MTESQECLVCGQALEYLVRQEPMTCSFCGKTFLSNARCRNGHYVCDTCHEKQGIIEIMDICRQEKSKNPAEILQKMMKNPYIYMHGPEHHIMVGASLLTAWHNAGGAVDFPAALEEMKDRGSRIPGGICGMWGTCGAAVSAGICFSIITSTNPLSTETWGLGNRLTAACLDAIGKTGGPRCCKRDSFTAVTVAADFIERHLGTAFEKPDRICCSFSGRNAQCIRLRCPYYSTESADSRVAAGDTEKCGQDVCEARK